MSSDAEIRWVPVREVGEVRMGKQLSPSSREAAGQHPYLRVANVYEGRIDLSDVKTMGFSSTEREVYGLRPGDILLNEGQESLRMVGRSAIYTGEPGAFCFQNTLIRFRPGGEVLPEYAQAVFVRWRAQGVFASVAEKTSISHLGGNRFGSLLFPLRPLPEQRRIVEVIDAVAAQERAIEVSIAKHGATRQAVIGQLLGSVEQEIPLVEGLAALEVGVASAGPEAVPDAGEWGVIRLGSVTGGTFDPTQVKRLPDGIAPRPECEIQEGDVLMVRVNGSVDLVGSVCVAEKVPPRLMLSDLVFRLTPKADVFVGRYLSEVLATPIVRLRIVSRFRGTSGQFQLPQSELRNLPVPFPELDAQSEICQVLDGFDAVLARERAELVKIGQLKQGLMDELLAGDGVTVRL
ncbi:restriction endonuclease subunit S [Streptomyces sp. MRC013]|uniref:restriction endonuclease subunit S n=1 Tax=Streptomyces sp. MRC013 TaxID=2898276 RepID=UPI002026DA11|nr:restriction endonuclease subunit S [Streptomyces sp. MRC013]URM91313.1 restriction endonuclease subunit S [Streptomyces sp. MRC013]